MRLAFLKRASVIATLIIFCLRVLAQEDLSCPNTSPISLSFTLSGGVSLGAYQAGFLYYAGQVLKSNPQLFNPKIITGASAGGINTLLSVFSLCHGDGPHPTQSPFWKAWVDLDTPELLAPNPDHRALLSREAFLKVSEGVRKLWFAGLPTTCDLVIGVPVTRISPETKSVWSALGVGQQAETFTLRIRGRGVGKAPLLTNYVNATNGGGQNILALWPGDDNQNFTALRDLMFATTAFPLVFAPEKLSYCVSDMKSSRWLHSEYPLTCLPNETETAEFLDGGLFDNQPIGLADQISRAGLANQCSSSKWREIPLVTSAAPISNQSVLFIYLDNDSHEYPAEKPIENQKYLLPYLGSFLNEFINSSQRRNVLSSFEQNPNLQRQVAVAKNFYPRISDPMFGFFGFLDRDFRKFDFYLGMYEAREYFKTQIRANLQLNSKSVAQNLVLPEDQMKDELDWQPLTCLSQILTSGAIPKACDRLGGQFEKNFKILAQLSIARLEALCSTYATKKRGASESACARVANRETYLGGESDLGFSLRKLSEAHFQFSDLGLKASDSEKAGAKMKTAIVTTIDHLASEQQWPDNLAVSMVGPLLVDAIERLPTERDAYISFGPALKIGASDLISVSDRYPQRFRFAAELQLSSIQAWLGGGGQVAPSLLAGFEYEIPAFTSKLMQTRLRIMGGYQFNSDQDVNSCSEFSNSSLDCRGGFLEPGLSFTFLERIRFQLDGQWFAFNQGPHEFSLVPSIGLQFYF